MKKILNLKNAIFLCLLIVPFWGISQVTITNIPLDNQLVARSASTNIGKFKVEGSIDLSQNSFNGVRLIVNKLENGSNSTYLTKERSFGTETGLVDFGFEIEIEAVLANYSLSLFGLTSGAPVQLALPDGTGNNIVAGDVYVIQGQSNAIAKMYEGSSSAYKSDFIRVYASGTEDSDGLD